MEPGHEDREYAGRVAPARLPPQPQWSPAMKTGNTPARSLRHRPVAQASMEPGHEDREYANLLAGAGEDGAPQWSPAMKTGNTRYW